MAGTRFKSSIHCVASVSVFKKKTERVLRQDTMDMGRSRSLRSHHHPQLAASCSQTLTGQCLAASSESTDLWGWERPNSKHIGSPKRLLRWIQQQQSCSGLRAPLGDPGNAVSYGTARPPPIILPPPRTDLRAC